MGVTHSQNNVIQKSFSESDQHISSLEDPDSSSALDNFIEGPIAEDLLIGFLSYVPAKDLILNCRLVCKQWKTIIDAQSVWRLKCERENVKLPTRKLPELPKHHYRYIYLHSISKTKNLVKNPCGENKLNDWNVVSQYNQDYFLVENPPAGSDPVPEEVGSQSCFATTYMLCEKYQLINLIENPIHRYLLHHDLVKIKVGEWCAARFDCACEYKLEVLLFDRYERVIDKFIFQYEEEQWTGRKWHSVTHEFDNVMEVCAVRFCHMGQDRQFWAGHYGSKMTGAFVELCFK